MLNHLNPHSWLLFWSYKILQNYFRICRWCFLSFYYSITRRQIPNITSVEFPPNPPKFLEIEPKKSTNHQKTKSFQVGHHIPLISLWYTMIYHIYIYRGISHEISPFAQDRLRGVKDLGHLSGAPRHERVAFATAEGDPCLSQQPGRDRQLITSGNLTFHIAISHL